MAEAFVTMVLIAISLCIWFMVSYKILDDESVQFWKAITIVMIASAFLGIEIYFLIDVLII